MVHAVAMEAWNSKGDEDETFYLFIFYFLGGGGGVGGWVDGWVGGAQPGIEPGISFAPVNPCVKLLLTYCTHLGSRGLSLTQLFI